VVRNIIVSHGDTRIVCQKFRDHKSFFTYPLDSNNLNIVFVDRVKDPLFTIDAVEISSKSVLLEYGDGYVSIPLM
jgi:hypothetical protein